TLTLNRAVGGVGWGTDGKGSLGVGGGIFFYNFVGGVTATVEDSLVTNNDAIGGAGRDGVAGGAGLGGGLAVGGPGSALWGPGTGRVRPAGTSPRSLPRGWSDRSSTASCCAEEPLLSQGQLRSRLLCPPAAGPPTT